MLAAGEPELGFLEESKVRLVSRSGQSLWVWDPETREPLEALLLTGNPVVLASSMGGRYLAYALEVDGAGTRGEARVSRVGVWDRELSREVMLQSLSTGVRCLAVDGQGKTVAVSREDGQVEVLRVGVRGSYRRFRARGSAGTPLSVLCFSPGGEILVGSPWKGERCPVEAWEVETGRLVFAGESPFPLRSLRFLPLGGKTWDSTGSPVASLARREALAEGLASRGEAWFAQGDWSGEYLLWGSAWSLVLHDSERGWVGYLDRGQLRWLGGPRLRLKARVDLHPESERWGLRELLHGGGGSERLFSSDGYTLRAWDPAEGNSKQLLSWEEGRNLAGLGLPWEGGLVFGTWGPRSGGSSGGLAGKVQHLLLEEAGEPPGREILGCGPETVLSGDGSRVAFFGGDVGSLAPGGTLVVRGLVEGAKDWVLDPGDSRPGGAVALSGRGRWVATSVYRSRTGSHAVAVFDLGAGKRRHLHPTLTSASLLCFSPDEECLAIALSGPTGEEGGGVWVKRLRGGGQVLHFPLDVEPVAMGFHPDARHLLVASADRCLWVLDLRLERILGHVEVPVSRASCLCFRPGGDRFFTGGEDGSVLSWNSRALLGRLAQGR